MAHGCDAAGKPNEGEGRGERVSAEAEPPDEQTGSEDDGSGEPTFKRAGRAGEDRALLVILRNVTDGDLPIFFEHQRDAVALRMAAFTSRECDAFLAHWRTKVLRPENVTRTIVVGGLVAGYIGS